MKNTKTLIKSSLLILAFFSTISALAVWFPPSSPFPTNVAAPLNVSANAQAKDGPAIFLGGFRSAGLSIFDSNVELGGTLKVGYPSGTGGSDGGASVASTSALLELNSTSKGLLLPRMTQAQRDAIRNPAGGLVIFQTDNSPGLRVYNGATWVEFQPLYEGNIIP